MRRFATIAALLAVATVGAYGGTASTAVTQETHARGCQAIKLSGKKRVFWKRNLACSSAKRNARHVHRTHGRWEPKGFNCRGGGRSAYCATASGRRGFGWYPYH